MIVSPSTTRWTRHGPPELTVGNGGGGAAGGAQPCRSQVASSAAHPDRRMCPCLAHQVTVTVPVTPNICTAPRSSSYIEVTSPEMPNDSPHPSPG